MYVNYFTPLPKNDQSEKSGMLRIDVRRFRMNVILKTERPGFVENDWVSHALALGEGVQLNIALLDPRCVMTTLAQDDLPQDTDVLRTLVRHNRSNWVVSWGSSPALAFTLWSQHRARYEPVIESC